MSANDFIFLPIILFLGVVTSYEDIKTSRIRNQWILLCLSSIFFIYLFFFLAAGLSNQGIISATLGKIAFNVLLNFHKWAINLCISTIAAYLLWQFDIWGAGDAKLFICYSALIPLSKYPTAYFGYYFASFALLLTTFIPAACFFLTKEIFYFIKKIEPEKWKTNLLQMVKQKVQKFNLSEVRRFFMIFFVFYLFFKMLRHETKGLLANIIPNENIVTIIIFLFFNKLSNFFKKKKAFLLYLFFIFFGYFIFRSIFFQEDFFLSLEKIFSRSIFVVILFSILNKIGRFFTKNSENSKAPFAPWMFLGTLIIWIF